MKRTNAIRIRGFAPALIGAAVLAAAPNAHAFSEFLVAWSTEYDTSASDDAGCLLCHDTNTARLNAYGAAICEIRISILDAFLAVEGLDSDQDPTESDNLTEIEANAQPGWTDGSNPVFDATDTIFSPFCEQLATVDTPPSGVPEPYDPGSGPEPGALDLDIAQLRVSKNARLDGNKAVGIKLMVENNGTVDTNGTATVTGEQGESVVYSETIEVFDGVGNGKTTFEFLDYWPTAAGEILWTATITDDDPDEDQETATTNVR